jgi:hypothetical protein
MGRSFAARVGPVEVHDLDGSAVALRQSWSQKTAVLLFVRHFG